VPTYQYACTECGHDFEQFQSFSDSTLTECPQCQGRLRKVFNAVGVVFKGSGFYRTDSRASPTASEPAAAAASSTGDSGSSAPATSGTKTETKSGAATKSDSKPAAAPAPKAS